MPSHGDSARADGRQIALDHGEQDPKATSRRGRAWAGLTVEQVRLRGPQTLTYRWTGPDRYLALHDIRLDDGEIRTDGRPACRRLDLRQRLTFVPERCNVSGWSRLTRGDHGFTALYYDPAALPIELEQPTRPGAPASRIYFDETGLRSTMAKVDALLSGPFADLPGGEVYAETLCLLAAIEMERLLCRDGGTKVAGAGRLSARQERRVSDYIEAHLDRAIDLSDLARLAGLSRFHFARCWRRTTGLPPHQYLLRQRVERAKRLMTETDLPIAEIASRVGFGDAAQLAHRFRKAVGVTPTQFRQAQA